MMARHLLCFFLLFPSLLATALWAQDEESARLREKLKSPFLSEGQRLIASAALDLVGRPNLRLSERSFPWDCSGTVLASLWSAGLDLSKEYGAGSGNGVNRLHQISQAHELDFDFPLPEIGDLIFWDNTYDKNEDLAWNDKLTHTAVVVGVDDNGTISYVHHDYRRGIVIARMNLFYRLGQFGVLPDGEKREINSPLRMNSQRYLNPDSWLSSHLFNSFSRIYRLIDERLPKTPDQANAASPTP